MASHVLKYSKYAIYHPTFTKKMYQTHIPRMNLPKSESFSIMDIGVGDGKVLFNILYPMLDQNCKEITAVDIDECMIEFCNEKFKKNHVEFIHLDVATDTLPESLNNRFHALFSSYCFMYVRDLRKALLNCKAMLKTNCDLLLVFISKKNPLYSTYSEMSKIDTWRPFTKNFEGFIPHFSSEDPASEATKLFEDVGMELVAKEFHHELEFTSNRRNFLETYKSMDSIYRTLPQEMHKAYEKDFQEIFLEISGINMKDKKNLDEPVTMNIPCAVLHGRKSPSLIGEKKHFLKNIVY